MLDRALLQVIQHLIVGWMSRAGDRCDFFEVVDVEIADAPGADLALGRERLEPGNGLLERHAAPPVQQVAIEPVCAQPAQ